MDIQKEREAFEVWWEKFHKGRQITCDYVEEDNSYSVGYANAQWVAWQARAQAVPEGYQLVKKPRPLVGNNNVDFSQAPEWAKFWLKDGYSKRYLWTNKRPKIDVDIGCFVFPYNYQVIEAPDFGFDGDWSKSLTSRKAMTEKQEPAND